MSLTALRELLHPAMTFVSSIRLSSLCFILEHSAEQTRLLISPH
jgi:hypothetical protein